MVSPCPAPDDGDERLDHHASEELEAQLPSVAAAMVAAQREMQQVAFRTLEVEENRDKLQHDYAVRQLETSDAQNLRSHQLARLVLLVFGGSFVILVFFLFYMAFFGSPAQAGIAMKILGDGAKVLGGALGGVGVLYLITGAMRRTRQ